MCARQNSCDTTTASGPPGEFSASLNSRPAASLTPRILKNCRDTPMAATRTGSLPTDTVASGAKDSDATPEKDFA